MLLGDEATLDPQPFLGDLLPTDVLMLLPEGLVVLLFKISLDLEVFLLRRQRSMLKFYVLQILLLILEDIVLLHQDALVKRITLLLLHFVLVLVIVLHLFLLEALELGLLLRRVELVGLAREGESRFLLLN